VSTPGSGSSSELRRANTRHLLGLIREHGPISRSDLRDLGNLSKPTVQAIIEDLLRADLVLESNESGPDSGSRRGPAPRRVRFNANHALVVGVDVGAAKMLVVLSNLDGEVLQTGRIPTPANATGRRLDQAVKVLIDECLEQAGIGRGRLAVVTVGTTGLVDRDTGSVTFSPQLPGWQGRAVAPALEQALGVPVLIESEAHLAMLGESWRGVATDVADAVFVQLGVGIGMGVLIGGEIYRGASGAAGEIGYLPIGDARPEGPEGMFEATIGSQAITRHLQGTPPSGSAALNPADVFSHAADDAESRAVVENMLGYLATGLVSISAVLNPELIVVGGGLAASLGPYVKRLQRELDTKVLNPPRVELSQLGDTAVAVGAIRRGVTYVERGLFDRNGQQVSERGNQ
jgi:predicted NBD/HSP70 family sugar kinase